MERGFGRAVVCVGRPRSDSAERADVDDASVGEAKRGGAELGEEEGGAGVGLHDFVPLVQGDLFEVARVVGAGVVDEEVEVAFESDRFGDGFADRVGVAHVTADGEGFASEVADGADERLGFICGVAEGEYDVRAGVGERKRKSTSDATCSSGYESDFSVESRHCYSRKRASRSCGWTGLARISKSCPEARAFSRRSAVAAWPEKRRILQEGRNSRMEMAASIPFMPGFMMTSLMTS